MKTRAAAVVLAMAVACTTASTARADSHGMFPVKAIAEGFRSEKTRVRGLYLALGAGWEAKKRVSLAGELGWAWGQHRSGLFEETTAYHVTLAPSLRDSLDGDDLDLDVALLGGRSGQSFVSGGISGGINLRYHDNVAAGPLMKGRLGAGPLTLYATLGAVFGGETSVIFGVGIEVFRLPPK